MTEEYKASGMQLRVPPDARGESFDVWLHKQALAKPGDIQAWIRRQAEERNAAGPKPKKKQSGALPDNTEWM